MEVVNKEVYKIGRVEFLSEEDAIRHEKSIENNKRRAAIIDFLLKEGFTRQSDNEVYRHGKYYTTYRFKLISDTIVLEIYESSSSDSHQRAPYLANLKSSMTFNLCNQETFRIFCGKMLPKFY